MADGATFESRVPAKFSRTKFQIPEHRSPNKESMLKHSSSKGSIQSEPITKPTLKHLDIKFKQKTNLCN